MVDRIEQALRVDGVIYQTTTFHRMFLITFLLPIVGYILGGVALFSGAGAFKWWIVGLIVGTWWSRGAISMALQGKAAGDLPQRSVSFSIFVHWVCLIGLIACSVIAIAT